MVALKTLIPMSQTLSGLVNDVRVLAVTTMHNRSKLQLMRDALEAGYDLMHDYIRTCGEDIDNFVDDLKKEAKG